jgi:4-amino-4-deoxy-L-arabinose transferase-like glycosyltransferase
MKFNNRIKLVLIALTLFIICLPLAFIITVFTNPFWLWIENTFSIESVGHSGPAEWCYITVYLLLICAGGLILLKFRNRKTE